MDSINLLCHASPISSTEKVRRHYLRAEQAFTQGQYEVFQKELKGLEKYPLYPYLLYADLRRRLVRATSSEISTFITTYSGSWFAEDIRAEWLRMLAKRQDWKQYLAYYAPVKNTELHCHYLYAISEENLQNVDFNDVAKIWLKGKTLPKSCDPMLELWQKGGGLTENNLLHRITLALNENNTSLAISLANALPGNQANVISHWLSIKDNELVSAFRPTNSPLSHLILRYRLQKLVDHDMDHAIQTWDKLKTRYSLNEMHYGNVLSNIAVKLIIRNDPRSEEWFRKIPTEVTTKAAREWRIRDAIAHQDWKSIIHATANVSKEEEGEEGWLYWRARAFENTGNKDEAQSLYSYVAQIRSYYGFLAAQKLGQETPLNHRSILLSEEILSEVAKMPSIIRTKELYLNGKLSSARREWDFTINRLPADQQMAAAKIAHSWGWHEGALMTAYKTPLVDDLEIRFPMPHLQTVLSESQKRSLNPALILGIIRQESAFMPDARSSVGALGLMQVRPESAKDFAKRVWKEAPPSNIKMMEPEYNIRVGSAFFAALVKQFGNQVIPSIAAYNAGAGRVQKWLPTKATPADEWIETLPYYETREYLKHILAYVVIYSNHLQKQDESIPLMAMVQPVPKPLAMVKSTSIINKTKKRK